MMHQDQVDWPYPGSRWWKFDLHTHTPASLDTNWAAGLTPEDWLMAFMRAGIDRVAVTDHNSGAWIDQLKAANAEMRAQADAGTPPEGYRELTLFPGVEISVNGGFHLLAILHPNATTGDIDSLLGQVRYRGSKGDCDTVTEASAVEAVRTVLESGAIPIPAHADGPKGLLQVLPDSRKSALDTSTVRQVMDIEEILAIEWIDRSKPPPEVVSKAAKRAAWVLGSDCHGVEGRTPGSRFTWIKMATPTLEGLRLALLDGIGISVRRSDEGEFEPFQTPKHFVTKLEIESARFMGNGTPERLYLTPYYNAVIGGRGTGKSTFIHGLRLAYRRTEELNTRGETEPSRRFDSFATTAKSRDDDGALREGTEIRVELCREGVKHRLRWRQDGTGTAIEEQDKDGDWQPSGSQALTAERFPIRLFSQGQIATMAGGGREALVGVIDEAAGINDLHRDFDDSKRAFASQRARLRELNGRLERRPEVERKLSEVKQKLDVLAETQHADILRAQQRAVRQRREVGVSLEQLDAMPSRLEAVTQEVLLDDWPNGVFEPTADADVLSWRQDAEGTLTEARAALRHAAEAAREQARNLRTDKRLRDWSQRADRAQTDYSELQSTLARQGVSDPDAFERLLQEREQLERELEALRQVTQERTSLESTIQAQWDILLEARKRITAARRSFVDSALANNRFVRIDVAGFGFEARSIERSLRKVLECEGDRFATDLFDYGSLIASATDDDRDNAVADAKQRLIEIDGALHGHFRNYLKSKLDRPEFADHVLCWFPEDDLRIEYSRAGDGQDWAAITQGSQGQRSAALLAFLLAFGEEPLVLDQPEDDLDNHLIYDLIVRQIRENKLRRQVIIVTHNPNVLVNGDAEMVHVLDFPDGQCRIVESGALQQHSLREEVCRVMEGDREAFSRRWARLGREV
ncbi:MAG: AAA family ATPase [Gammaproteobacteria bacterium]|nr:AAA family ATPase [Gammaproteobacteria bacterium]